MQIRGFVSIQLSILVFIMVIAGITGLAAFAQAQASARDQERLLDIKQVAGALKIYFDENGFYPSGNEAGAASGMSSYLDFWPAAPKPDGSCTKNQNTYSYSQKSSDSDYLLTFCLGHSVDRLSAGTHSASARGIQ